MRRQSLCAALLFAAIACDGADIPTSATPDGSAFTIIIPSNLVFYDPVKVRPEVNKRVAGASTLVRFSLGGDFGMDIFPPGFPATREIDRHTREPITELEPLDLTGHGGLHFAAGANVYSFVFDTDPDWTEQYRQLLMSPGDVGVADFDFQRQPTGDMACITATLTITRALSLTQRNFTTVSGKLTCSDTGLPIANMAVTVTFPSGATRTVTTNQGGEYTASVSPAEQAGHTVTATSILDSSATAVIAVGR